VSFDLTDTQFEQIHALFPTKKAYLDGKSRQLIESQGGVVVIPPKSNAKAPHDYDEAIYRLRHLIENFFSAIEGVSSCGYSV
jgi:hypothetical protein